MFFLEKEFPKGTHLSKTTKIISSQPNSLEAGEGVRTLDNDVGNVVLCQLSYARDDVQPSSEPEKLKQHLELYSIPEISQGVPRRFFTTFHNFSKKFTLQEGPPSVSDFDFRFLILI